MAHVLKSNSSTSTITSRIRKLPGTRVKPTSAQRISQVRSSTIFERYQWGTQLSSEASTPS